MWPFRRQPVAAADPHDRERLDDVEDRVIHLERRFTRLQQQVTRWSRAYDLDDDDGEDEVLDEILEQRRRNHG